MKKLSIVLCILMFSTFFSGCTTDRTEIDDQVYSLVMGLDKGVDNKMRLTVQFPTYKEGGGGGSTGGMKKDGGGGDEEGLVSGTIIQTVEAPSILEGIDMMNSSTSRRISLVHAKAIIFSEALAREDLQQYMEAVVRTRETREIIRIMVCKGTAEDFIKENKTNIGESMSKAMELFAKQSANTGYFPDISFEDFYINALSPYEQPYCIYVGLNDFKNLKPVKGDEESPLKTQVGLLPGEEPRKGDRKIEAFGTVVFNGAKMVGVLDSYETRYFLMAIGDFQKGYISIEDKNAPGKAYALGVRLGRNPIVKAHFENGTPVIDLKLNIEADIGLIQSRYPYTKLENIEELNNQIKTVIQEGVQKVIKKTQREYNCDIFAFGRKVAHSFRTIPEFEKYFWLNRYKDAKVNVDVTANVRRSGLLFEDQPVRNNKDLIITQEEK